MSVRYTGGCSTTGDVQYTEKIFGTPFQGVRGHVAPENFENGASQIG